MDLPTEIWNHIFALACTDNGFTGRSLSLVSRYFHEASKSVKLQSLSLTEPGQILSLSRLLADTEPNHRQIRYLFLASSHTTDTGREGSISAAGGLDGTAQSTADKRLKSVMEASLHIIRAVSPTITVLHVHLELHDSLVFPISIPFPSLVELSLYGPCFDFGSPSLSECRPTFPSLRRLHLADGCDDRTKCFRRIASVAPSLTHLSLVFRLRSSFIDPLLALLGIPPDSSSNSYDVTVETLPLTLKMVLIDLGPAPIYRWCGPLRRYCKQNLQSLRAIAREDTRVHVPPVKARQRRGVGIAGAEWYWLDGIKGGDRAWTVP